MRDISSRADIEMLVKEFYAKVRKNEVLAIIRRYHEDGL
jgi:truncated hemoglobin YjbI